MTYYLGLDLGGTNIKVGLVDDNAKVLADHSVSTPAADGPGAVITALADAAGRVVQRAGLTMRQVTAVGIGAPGPLDFEQGVVKAAPNMPGWTEVPLRDRVSSLTGRPTVLENDANAAAFGEFWAGAGRDRSIRDFIMLTLGTGIGSGLIVDGKLIHGHTGVGGEGGHMIVQPDGRLCGCGQRGCLEAYCSAAHTAQRALEAIHAGRESSLKKHISHLTARLVFEAAQQGDGLALNVIDDTAKYLGIACVNFCRLFDPQMVVFAGGMINAGDLLFDRVRKAFETRTWALTDQQVRIVPAVLGNDAGFIGAAAVARDAHQHDRLSSTTE